MTNDATRASSEALPNRRYILAGLAAAPACGAAMVASPAIGGVSDATSLIEAHRSACRASHAAWGAIPEYDDTRPPSPTVRVGWMLGGRDDDGNDIREPIYRHTKCGVEKQINSHRDALVGVYGHDPNRCAQIMSRARDRVSSLCAELERQERAIEEYEARRGITAATQWAHEASRHVDACLNAIISHRPASLLEVQEIAAYLAFGIDNSDDVDGEDFTTALEAFVRNLGGASS